MSTPTYDVKFIKALGARIQKIRRKKDITQEKLASAVDMHVVSIALVENGKRNISVDNLRKICRVLKVKFSIFDDLI